MWAQKGRFVTSLRIAVAGFSHETNTFAPWRTDLEDFVANGYFRGEELNSLSGTNTVIGGAVDAIAADQTLTLLPIIATSAIPGGLVTARAAHMIESEIIQGLEKSNPDAVVLDLHGAMVTEAVDDGEASILRKVRTVVGPNVPIIAVYDLHVNISHEMVELADVSIPYDTYPHVDCAERGAEAVRIAARAARGEIHPTSALTKIPMLPPGPKQFSGSEPTISIMNKAIEMERRPNVINVGVCFAFPYADCPFPGMGVVVTTDNVPDLAKKLSEELADYIWDRREEFRPETSTVEEAIHRAMESEGSPFVLADLGDNPGGGTACDGTALLWGLIDLGAPDSAMGVMVDPSVVEAARQAGIGAKLSLNLGGRTDQLHGYPIPIVAIVESLSNGDFIYEGPMEAGRHDSLGQTAVLECEGRYDNTVRVIVCERRVQALDAAVFRSQGIEPKECKIVAVKSAVHFRGSFTPIAHEIIEVDTPGLTSIDFTRFPYRRMPRPIWPLDEMSDRR